MQKNIIIGLLTIIIGFMIYNFVIKPTPIPDIETQIEQQYQKDKDSLNTIINDLQVNLQQRDSLITKKQQESDNLIKGSNQLKKEISWLKSQKPKTCKDSVNNLTAQISKYDNLVRKQDSTIVKKDSVILLQTEQITVKDLQIEAKDRLIQKCEDSSKELKMNYRAKISQEKKKSWLTGFLEGAITVGVVIIVL